WSQGPARQRGDEGLLRHARGARPQEEALHVGAARLAEAPAQRGHLAGDAARERSEEADPAAAWRTAQERAGRASVRAPRIHGAAEREPVTRPDRPVAMAGTREDRA